MWFARERIAALPSFLVAHAKRMSGKPWSATSGYSETVTSGDELADPET
jgi:hypothetical protein